MMHALLPPIFLIVFIAGLPQFCETIYTPSLPEIVIALQTSESMVEYTITIYLLGMAIGTFFWGKLSDKLGRKPCVLAGLVVFILGCIGCYMSDSITLLIINRFIQAFGASVGSVLGQAIVRDAFHGPYLGKAYSSIGSVLAFSPAIGPTFGVLIAKTFGWSSIFLFLMALALILVVLVVQRLPETHTIDNRKSISIAQVALNLLKDKEVIGFGLIVGACNGISFSYFAEGSFYLINMLGLSSIEYGLSFIAIAVSTMLGGMLSKRLHKSHTSRAIMMYGLKIILIACTLFSGLALWYTSHDFLPKCWMIGITMMMQMIIMFGVCMTTSNALALALINYKWCSGAASSLFGFFYYCLISLFTLGMGLLHNNTLLPMPLYFLGISVSMLVIQKYMIRR